MAYEPHEDPNQRTQTIVAGILAAVLTFFLFPFAFNNTVEHIQAFSEANYGFGGGVIAFLWGLIVAAFVYGAAYLGVSHGIVIARAKSGEWGW